MGRPALRLRADALGSRFFLTNEILTKIFLSTECGWPTRSADGCIRTPKVFCVKFVTCAGEGTRSAGGASAPEVFLTPFPSLSFSLLLLSSSILFVCGGPAKRKKKRERALVPSK